MESLQTATSNSSSENATTVTESLDADSTPTVPRNTPSAATEKPAALTASSATKPAPAAQKIAAAPQPERPALTPASLPVTSVGAPGPLPTGSAQVMVQIAAVSHQEDADALISALRQHGYSVAVRNEPQDKLLHVQVGPFATRDAAKAMRAKLLSDGYNAILKP
jgi:cell division septation protein DedD